MSVISTTAKELFEDTIQERPELFASGAWFSLDNFREKVLHPFDRKRLELSYSSPGEAWAALKHAICQLPWVETRGEGLEIEFRCKHIPSNAPANYSEAMALIDHYKKALVRWKDSGQQLLELTAITNALNLSMEASEYRLLRAGALIHYFRTMAQTFAQDIEAATSKKRLVRTPTPFDLEGILANPAAYGKVMGLLELVGILTPEKLEEFGKEKTNG